MSESSKRSARSEARLAELARQDAGRVTPGFSETLHRRVMRNVELASLPDATLKPRALNYEIAFDLAARRRRSRIVAAGLAAAALVALAVIPTGMRFGQTRQQFVEMNHVLAIPLRQTPSYPRPSPPPTLNQVADVVKARVQEVVQMAMAEQQYEGLDHDVRLATHYLVDQVPLRSAWLNDEGPKAEE